MLTIEAGDRGCSLLTILPPWASQYASKLEEFLTGLYSMINVVYSIMDVVGISIIAHQHWMRVYGTPLLLDMLLQSGLTAP